jgi:hypothetical protein
MRPWAQLLDHGLPLGLLKQAWHIAALEQRCNVGQEGVV